MRHLLALPYYKEVWKDIKGYEGLYQVSNFGRVKNSRTGRILKPKINNKWYLTVNLYKNGEMKNCTVHRLVLEAFKPNPHNYPTVDHINRIRTDNRADNLRWAPWELQAKNRNQTLQIEVLIKNNIKYKSISVSQYTLDMEFVGEYSSTMDAERQTGVDHSHISACCKGKLKTAGGYIWKYK